MCRCILQKKQIEFLHKVDVSVHDLERLSNEAKILLLATCQAVSEVNVFLKMYLSISHERTKYTEINAINNAHRHIIIRNMTSKLFEYHEFLGQMKDSDLSDDAELSKAISDVLDGWTKLKNSDGYKVVRSLRHEATFHYSADAFRKSLKHLDSRGDMYLLFHEMQGNDIHPIGVELVFVSRLRRMVGRDARDEIVLRRYEAWHGWSLEALSWLRSCLEEFWLTLFFEPIGKSGKKMMFWLDSEYVGDLRRVKMPVFHRTED